MPQFFLISVEFSKLFAKLMKNDDNKKLKIKKDCFSIKHSGRSGQIHG